MALTGEYAAITAGVEVLRDKNHCFARANFPASSAIDSKATNAALGITGTLNTAKPNKVGTTSAQRLETSLAGDVGKESGVNGTSRTRIGAM